MAGNEDSVESPMELLRQLIEESGKWVDEIVKYARQQLIVLTFVIIQSVTLISYIFYNISKEQEPIPLTWITVISICVIFTVLTWGNAIIQLRRKYRNRLARRDRWREKFEVLRKKEEEIEKLLSEGAE